MASTLSDSSTNKAPSHDVPPACAGDSTTDENAYYVHGAYQTGIRAAAQASRLEEVGWVGATGRELGQRGVEGWAVAILMLQLSPSYSACWQGNQGGQSELQACRCKQGHARPLASRLASRQPPHRWQAAVAGRHLLLLSTTWALKKGKVPGASPARAECPACPAERSAPPGLCPIAALQVLDSLGYSQPEDLLTLGLSID